MKKYFWELLAILGFWIPCEKLLPPKERWDWVIISHKEKYSGFRGLPSIGEYSYKQQKWHTDHGDVNEDAYIQEYCIVTHWHRLPSKIKEVRNELH